MKGNFGRYLSGPWRKALSSGPGRELLGALADLDLRVRDEYLNLYSAGNSVVRLSPRRLELHHKYAKGCELDGKRSGEYLRIPFTEAGVQVFLGALPQIRKNVADHQQPEGGFEEAIIRANLSGTPLIVLDRQVRVPGDKERNELDLLAIAPGDVPMAVAIELKYGLDNRIQRVPAQVHRYVKMLDPEGAGLRRDVARSYQVAAKQLAALNRPAPDPRSIAPGMPVRGLLVLGNYNENSELLDRARASATTLHRPLFLWKVADPTKPLPGPREWEPLR